MFLTYKRSGAFILSLLLCLLFMMTAASAEDFDRPLLFLNLPNDAQMIENVEFDDGDFIQTYQLDNGAHITLLRYGEFNMSAQDLLASEWDGAASVETLPLEPIDGCSAEGVRFTFADLEAEPLLVTLIVVTAGQDTLVFEAAYPAASGEESVNAAVNSIIESMHVITMSDSNLG